LRSKDLNSGCQLVLRSLRFAYESAAWSLEIPALSLGGEPVCGIVGPNGSGKSTLLKIAAGLLPAGTGEVSLNGQPLARMRRAAIARVLGFLPQECPALFDYTVEQVATMGRHAHGGVLEMSAPGDREAVARALADTGLEPMRRRRLSQLSGGERRRTWIASALAQEPDILLLDEPTQSLDLHQAAAVMEVLSRRAANGMRVIAVLHDLNLAALYSDRLVLLQNGEIAADGLPGEILTRNRLFPVYGDKIEVFPHPETKTPLVLVKK
jgi:iron complex transport system ATP-binding protein